MNEKAKVYGYFLPISKLNEPMQAGIEKLIDHAKRARWTNAVVRKDAVETLYEADWIKSLIRICDASDINGLTEAETNASASVMGLTRPAAKPEDIPAIFKEQAS